MRIVELRRLRSSTTTLSFFPAISQLLLICGSNLLSAYFSLHHSTIRDCHLRTVCRAHFWLLSLTIFFFLVSLSAYFYTISSFEPLFSLFSIRYLYRLHDASLALARTGQLMMRRWCWICAGRKKNSRKTIEQNCINEGLEELGEILEVFMNHRMKIDGFSSNRWWSSHNMCGFFEIFGPSEKCWSDLYESFWLWVLTEFVWIRWKGPLWADSSEVFGFIEVFVFMEEQNYDWSWTNATKNQPHPIFVYFRLWKLDSRTRAQEISTVNENKLLGIDENFS